MWSASSSTVTSISAERARPAVDQVDQAAGRRDQHVDTTREGRDLLVDRQATRDEPYRQGPRGGQWGQRIGDLHGQLAGRHEHETTRTVRRTRGAGQPRDHRQAEGKRLAGSGCGPAEQVVANQRVGDRRGLDRERRGDAGPVERADESTGQPELAEAGQVVGGDDLNRQVVPARTGGPRRAGRRG